MKKLILVLAVFSFSTLYADFLRVATTVSGSVDKVGRGESPGLLFKFELPAELQNARIDLAQLRFNVVTDTAQKITGFLVRPMLAPWISGLRLPALPDSTASPFHVNFGRVNFKDGTGEIEITQIVKAWFTPSRAEGQGGELPNFGLLVYPAAKQATALQLRNLPGGGVAELEIFYTPTEIKPKE